jgi:class 3 adenylate cyclase
VRRLRTLDAALLALLAPLWALCVALHVVRASEHRIAWLPLQVEAGPEGWPLVRGFVAGVEGGASGVQPGDTLVRVGSRDLQGIGALAFTAAAWAELGPQLRAPLVWRRGGEERSGELVLAPVSRPLRTLPLTLITGAVVILVFLRTRGGPLGRAVLGAGVAHSLQWASFFGPVPWQSSLALATAIAGATLTFPLMLRAILLLPVAPRPPTRIGREWPWLFLAMGPAVTSWLLGWPLPSEDGLRAVLALNVVFALAALALLTSRYARAGAAGRRKLKWLLLGYYLAMLPLAAASGLAAFDPSFVWLQEVAAAASVAIPISICIAIVRDDFLDIDRLLTETAAWTGASLLLLLALLQGIPTLSRWLAESGGIDQAASQALVLAAVAGVGVPARRWLSPLLQRLFFRERGAIEGALGRLRDELDHADDPGRLLEILGGRLSEIFEPEGCVVYARADDSFGPVYISGSLVPPAFEADGALVALLEEQEAPADAARWRRWRRTGLIRGEAGAALDALQPALIVPVRGAGRLAAFVCLGPRHSGELYGASEKALLAALSERASSCLRRAGDVKLLERSHELRAKLERYVPSVIAKGIERGEEIAPREREVSVLFVDIRGYTRFSETRSPEEIFDLVSRYTELVSGIVARHGGSVVEFHGDGLMAVFGAPRELPDKELAAVETAREVVREVPRLEVPGDPLSVGVGIATGTAFVGNIRSADRVIWGALGNTTNLAARLQAMSRELVASVVIDAVTRERAREAAVGFVDQGELPVRGRSQGERAFALPLLAA